MDETPAHDPSSGARREPRRPLTTEVAISSLAYGGEGVGRLPDGRAVFVPATCPGDRVDVSVTEEHDRWARASLESLLEPSPDRVEPPCPYAGACGGCQWQHIAYERQVEAKRQSVVDALSRIGRFPAEELVLPCLAAAQPLGYRNKVELVVSTQQGRPALGYHRAGSAEIVPVERCLLLPGSAQDAPRKLQGALRYLAGASELAVERVGLRVAQNAKDFEVALWEPPGPSPRTAVATTLGSALPTTSIVRVLFKGALKERQVARVEVLSGRGFWRERVGQERFTVSAPSFFQVNTAMTGELVAAVVAALEADGSDRVLDVYAGVGTFTLPLSRVAGEVTAIESSGSALRDLRRNLDDAGLDADVVPGDAARALAEVGRAELALVDPPRAGLGANAIRALVAARPGRIAYVSCDPTTLARDARSLADAGYELLSARPVDLFPQAFHVETVATFRKA